MDVIIQRKNIYKFLIFLLMFEISLSNQETFNDISSNNFKTPVQKYTNIDGRIMISVNLWGMVSSPGRHIVPENVDLVTILSIVGGPIDGANMSKIKVIRDLESSSQIFIINLNKFIKSGDKSDLIKIEPNDTIIIPETVYNGIFKRLSSLNTILSLLNLYYALTNNS